MILVLGSNGQVGYELKEQLQTKYELLTPTRQELDLSDLKQVEQYLEYHTPESIINAAAYTQVDKAESQPKLADIVNHRLPKLLAEYSAETHAYLLHYSTDYVYAGEGDHPQDETTRLNPQSVYAQTKLAGDQAIKSIAANYSILRTSWVYSYRGHNFMNTMLKLAKERDELSIVNDQIGAPISADLLATFSVFAFESELHGVYNLTLAGETSWYEFAMAVFEQAKQLRILEKVPKLHPIATADYPTLAKRPLNSRLDCNKLFRTLDGVKNLPWEAGLEIEMAKRQFTDLKRT